MEYDFDPIILTEGTYWIRGHIIGPENCFWMIRGQVSGTECWCDYQDLAYYGPGSGQFGSSADLAFQLYGEMGGPTVPLSNYALYFGILLIVAYGVFRYRRMV